MRRRSRRTRRSGVAGGPQWTAAAGRRARVTDRPAPRADPAADRAERDPRGRPAGEPAAPGRDARARQLLRLHRAGSCEGAAVGAAHHRAAVPARHPGHRRPARLLVALRERPARLGTLGDRPAQPEDLPAPGGQRQGSRPEGGGAADARALRARPQRPGRLRRLPAAAGRGQLLRGRAADAGEVRGRLPARGESGPGAGDRRLPRRVRRLLRDRRPPLHQPGDPPLRHPGALRPGARERHRLQGVRERRRPLPDAT